MAIVQVRKRKRRDMSFIAGHEGVFVHFVQHPDKRWSGNTHKLRCLLRRQLGVHGEKRNRMTFRNFLERRKENLHGGVGQRDFGSLVAIYVKADTYLARSVLPYVWSKGFA